jgi:hypothetical protein
LTCRDVDTDSCSGAIVGPLRCVSSMSIEPCLPCRADLSMTPQFCPA